MSTRKSKLRFKINGQTEDFIVTEKSFDSELDQLLRDLVNDIGPFRRKIRLGSDLPIRTQDLSVHHLLGGFTEQILAERSYTSDQIKLLDAIYSQLVVEGPTALESTTNALSLTTGVDSLLIGKDENNVYLLWASGEKDVPSEVIFQTTSDNGDGVDWLDVVLQVIGELFGLAIGIRLGAAAVKRLNEAIGEGVKAILRNPKFREALKKLADAIGEGRLVKIYEALKELVEILWENRNLFCNERLRKFLNSLMSWWRIVLTFASWVVAFLSGGASKLGQAAAIAATIGLKFVKPALEPET